MSEHRSAANEQVPYPYTPEQKLAGKAIEFVQQARARWGGGWHNLSPYQRECAVAYEIVASNMVHHAAPTLGRMIAMAYVEARQ